MRQNAVLCGNGLKSAIHQATWLRQCSILITERGVLIQGHSYFFPKHKTVGTSKLKGL